MRIKYIYQRNVTLVHISQIARNQKELNELINEFSYRKVNADNTIYLLSNGTNTNEVYSIPLKAIRKGLRFVGVDTHDSDVTNIQITDDNSGKILHEDQLNRLRADYKNALSHVIAKSKHVESGVLSEKVTDIDIPIQENELDITTRVC